jgi:hypothetical protein
MWLMITDPMGSKAYFEPKQDGRLRKIVANGEALRLRLQKVCAWSHYIEVSRVDARSSAA